MNPVAMGSCKMFLGENKEYVKAQVKRMAKQHPDRYFFDIICLPEQIEEAIGILRYFYTAVKAEMPWLDPAQVFTAITHDGMIRPASMALVILSGGKSPEFMDVNPGRDQQ